MLKLKNIKRTKADKELLKKEIAHLGRTFCSKLVIKLIPEFLIHDLYLYILKYEYANRTKEDINKILPKILHLKDLIEYIKYGENKKNNDYNEIIKELSKISFHQRKKKFEIIKRENEDINKFIYVINGSICKLNLIIKKEKISIEEYLIYMIELEILQEKQILNKCNSLNENYIGVNDFQKFFEENKEYNYQKLKTMAINELIFKGFKFSNNKIELNSPDTYLNIGKFKIKERNDTNIRFNLYIGKYIKIKTLEKGEFIGDLSLNENKEGNIYISENKIDIAYINKIETKKSVIYKYIYQKYKKIFLNKIDKFFIFKDITKKSQLEFEKIIFPYFIYKHYKKDEYIIKQDSLYEGVYLILDGKIKLSVSKTLNELSKTLISLQYSVYNFKDYASKIIKTVDILNEFHLKYMINKNKKIMIDVGENKVNIGMLSSRKYLDFLEGIKYIEFFDMEIGDILGTNELFDYKTEIYNFSAKCISDEAHLFFIPKKIFNNILEKELTIMNNVIKLIDLKAKALIGKINNFRINYSKGALNYIKKQSLENININNLNKEINNNNKNDSNILEKSHLSNFDKFKSRIFKKKKIKLRNHLNVKLFKNNSLLIYLQNRKLVRDNSISDNFNINIGENINKKSLSSNSSKNNIFSNFSYLNEINQEKKLMPSNSQINLMENYINLNMKKSNSIIYKRNSTHLGDGSHLLINVLENQKKYDEFKKEYFYKSEYNNLSSNSALLPLLNNQKNKRNKKLENIKKKFGRTINFKFSNLNNNWLEN